LGNVNNIYTTPQKPTELRHQNGVGESKSASEDAAGKLTKQNGVFPQLVSDFATTIAATDGTSSAFSYVASGVGAAIHGVIGLDPINPDQMSVKSPPVSPAPLTPNAIAALVEESTPASETDNKEVPTSQSTKATSPPVAPTIEPSTHTPVTPGLESPSKPSVVSSPSAEVVPSDPSLPETSTHIAMAAPVKAEPSVDTLPLASTTNVAASATESASPAVEASTHTPVVASVVSENAPATESVPPAALSAVPTTEVVPPPESTPPAGSVEASTHAPVIISKASDKSPAAAAASSAAPFTDTVELPSTETKSAPQAEAAAPTRTAEVNADSPSKTEDSTPAPDAAKTGTDSAPKTDDAAPPVPSTTAEPAATLPKTNGASPSKPKDASTRFHTRTSSFYSTFSRSSRSSRKESRSFPSTDSPESSPPGTASSRRRRKSFFGKIKDIFHHDKEEKETWATISPSMNEWMNLRWNFDYALSWSLFFFSFLTLMNLKSVTPYLDASLFIVFYTTQLVFLYSTSFFLTVYDQLLHFLCILATVISGLIIMVSYRQFYGMLLCAR
jgi:hypothetical protein